LARTATPLEDIFESILWYDNLCTNGFNIHVIRIIFEPL
jgi:hypothetical protein